MRTAGTIKYDRTNRAWVVQAEPHVVMRLKRCFGKLDKSGHGKHQLSDNVENARDLEWFLSRYPLEGSTADFAYLAERAAEHKERESLVDALLSRRVDVPPFNLAVPAREYQRLAAALALHTRGLLIADDVGLGKTASAICSFTDPRTLPALVVTLAHLPRQWQAEIKKFAPQLRTHIIKRGSPYDLTQVPGKRNGQLALPSAFPDVVIMNYHKLSGWASTLGELRFASVVYDEVQELRRGVLGIRGEQVSAKAKAARYISDNVEFRQGLSATPILNYGDEFFSVINALKPGALGEFGEFRREWCSETYGGKIKIKDAKAFGAYLREQGLMIRRTRAEVGRELPGLTNIPHHIEADTAALDRVSASCAELARLILREGEEHKGQKMMASEEFNNALRQATGIAKAAFVAQFVRLLVESGERILLSGWHRQVYAIWLDLLKDLNPVMYTGSESAVQKEESKRKFLARETPVMIISNRAGQGLDGLQKVCRTLVVGELDWSPAIMMEQLPGRIYRDGQSDPVMAYYLLADYGADPVISDILGIKQGQSEPVLNPDKELVEKLTVDPNHIKKLAAAYLEQAERRPARAMDPEVQRARMVARTADVVENTF